MVKCPNQHIVMILWKNRYEKHTSQLNELCRVEKKTSLENVFFAVIYKFCDLFPNALLLAAFFACLHLCCIKHRLYDYAKKKKSYCSFVFCVHVGESESVVTEVTRNVTEITNYMFAFYFKVHPLKQ